ncbi:hemolysin D [Nostoc minutum NIES-26]|uniref:Hemolysin D n=1 Tax=Nostoc minutum NIES-26 TaxID=1844469 RepID=A0A367S5K1_9NOSO|nr:hemolysin D [Nostoc minutum NIES-26]
MTGNLLLKPTSRKLLLILIATAATSGIVVYCVSQFEQVGRTTSPQPVVIKSAPKVTALGRIEPETEVISLSAPLVLDGDRVMELRVKEGDIVQTGQIVAILDARDRLQIAVLQAAKQVRVAQAKLEQVKAGAKTGDIQAQQASIERLEAEYKGNVIEQQEVIARIDAQWQGDKITQQATIKKLEAELNNAQSEYRRYQKLYSEGVISNSLFDSKRLSLETGQQQLDEAKAVLTRINSTASRQLAEAKVSLTRIQATGIKEVSEAKAILNSIAEIRPVDVQAAKMELENALAALKRAQTELQAAYIKAPITGQILKIHTRVGEKISDSGVADIAQTEKMIAVTEVYQTDIGKVKLGQSALLTSQAFNGQLRGEVYYVGFQINRQNVFSNQPGENLDTRIVEVKIRLNPEDSKKVAGFTNLQVQTAIKI